MDLSKTITFLKENFETNAIEIYECLNLLADTLDSTLMAIQKSSANAFEQRDFARIKQIVDIADEINNVQRKTKEYMERLHVNLTEEPVSSYEEDEGKVDNDSDEYKVDSSIRHTLNEDFSYKKPAAFEIDSARIEVKDWRDLFYLTCEILAKKDIVIFESFINDPSMNGKKIKYFSKVRKGMTSPKRLTGTDIYISMQMGANSIKNLIAKMLRKFGTRIDEYYVYFSEDYTSMFKIR